ncbi:hypothetical protein GR223_37610, partial [Rhizobium leguminosarum]|uniref:hypothetical protein n=1 Tax=Rhizobium ruizarguesonis TaxID=2081791 RepID=UPI0013E083E9
DIFIVVGYRAKAVAARVTLLAEIAPFAISRVEVDRGGDSRWVTFDVYGAKFSKDRRRAFPYRGWQ